MDQLPPTGTRAVRSRVRGQAQRHAAGAWQSQRDRGFKLFLTQQLPCSVTCCEKAAPAGCRGGGETNFALAVPPAFPSPFLTWWLYFLLRAASKLASPACARQRLTAQHLAQSLCSPPPSGRGRMRRPRPGHAPRGTRPRTRPLCGRCTGGPQDQAPPTTASLPPTPLGQPGEEATPLAPPCYGLAQVSQPAPRPDRLEDEVRFLSTVLRAFPVPPRGTPTHNPT